MTPVRIHKRIYDVHILCAFTTMSFFLPIVCLLISVCEWWSGRSGLAAALLEGLAFSIPFSLIFGALSLLSFYPLLAPPIWVEIGDRLTYRTLLDVHTHEWSEIRAIYFRHEVQRHEPFDESEAMDPDWYEVSTKLVITFANGKRIRLPVPSGWGGGRYQKGTRRGIVEEEVIRTLVDGLRSDDACTRRHAAEALGRFVPDTIGGETHQPETTEARRRANASKAALRNAVLRLEKATKDTDAGVRKAATASRKLIIRFRSPENRPYSDTKRQSPH